MAILTKAMHRGITQPCDWSAHEALNDARRQLRRVAADVRHQVEDVTASTTRSIRRRPMAAVGFSAGTGLALGMLLGAITAWHWKKRG